MKKWFFSLLLMLGSYALFIVFGFSPAPNVVKAEAGYTGTGPIQIHVVSHGWHTGFIIPTEALEAKLPALKARFGNAPMLEIGWGDKGFYQAETITLGISLRAMFWPSESVVHVVAVTDEVHAFFPHSQIRTLRLSQRGFATLVRFLTNSFHQEIEGEIMPLRKGIYGDSQFYQGVGDYFFLNTCNKWTAKGLKSSGLDINPTLKLSASGVMDYLESLNP